MLTITIPIPKTKFLWIIAIVCSIYSVGLFVYYGDTTDQRSLVIDFPDHYMEISLLSIIPLLFGFGFFTIKSFIYIGNNLRIKFKGANNDL